MSNDPYTPLPPMSHAVSGFTDSDAPIIDGFRWYHWGAEKTFTTVAEVLDYHNTQMEEVHELQNDAPTLEAFFKDIPNLRVGRVEIFIRFVRNGRVVMEPVLYHRPLENDPYDPARKRVRNVRFATRNQGDGLPFYDFSNMADRGDYECVIYTYDRNGKYLAIRIPFRFSLSTEPPPHNGDGDDREDEDPDEVNDPELPEEPPDPSFPDDEGDSPIEREGARFAQTYELTIIDGLSPFTKKPATQYRPAAVAVLKNDLCKGRIPTPDEGGIYRPIFASVVGIPSPPECGFGIFPRSASVPIGTEFSLQFTHNNLSGVETIYAMYGDDLVERVENNVFKAIGVGQTTVSFVAQYMDGQQCEATDTFSLDIYGECQLDIQAESFTALVGEPVVLTINHGNNLGVDQLPQIDVEYPPDIQRIGNQFTSQVAGTYLLTYHVEYPNGLHCSRTVTIQFI